MVSREFMDNVQNGNAYRVRSVLLDYLIIDSTFKTFDEAFEYASRHVQVTQKYDNEPFELDKKKWNMRYLNVQKATLMLNFAPERIKHLKEVITYLNEIGATPKPAEPSEKKTSKPASGNSRTGRTIIGETERGKEKESSADSQKRQTAKKSEGKTGRKQISEKVHSESDTSDRRSEPRFNVGIAMAVGGGAIAVAGAVTLKPVVVAAGVAVAGAGCAIISANRQK